jgi:acetolactate synthase regulatory subunit
MTMIESIAIDFRPGETVVPRILTLVDREGFSLRGLRLVPTRGCDRATLRIDVGDSPSRAQLQLLEDQLASFDEIIEVIHRANIVERRPAAA